MNDSCRPIRKRHRLHTPHFVCVVMVDDLSWYLLYLTDDITDKGLDQTFTSIGTFSRLVNKILVILKLSFYDSAVHCNRDFQLAMQNFKFM